MLVKEQIREMNEYPPTGQGYQQGGQQQATTQADQQQATTQADQQQATTQADQQQATTQADAATGQQAGNTVGNALGPVLDWEKTDVEFWMQVAQVVLLYLILRELRRGGA